MQPAREQDLIARTEHRVRRYLQRWGRCRLLNLYHGCCAPHYLLSKERFTAIVWKLHEEGVCELLDGAQARTVWVVRRDLVDQTIKDGVLVDTPVPKVLTPECA